MALRLFEQLVVKAFSTSHTFPIQNKVKYYVLINTTGAVRGGGERAQGAAAALAEQGGAAAPHFKEMMRTRLSIIY